MAFIRCPACGETHKYMATALATLLEAALAGDLHTVGIEAIHPVRTMATGYRRAVVVSPVCPLTVVPQHGRPVAEVR